jgi:hypothetical protein
MTSCGRSGAGGRARVCCLLALSLALLAACSPAVGDSHEEPTRTFMSEFVRALQVVLPPSLSREKFADPDRRAEILEALHLLAANSGRLDRHAAGGESGFAFLSYSLARDIRDIEQRYSQGRTDEARFLLLHVTEVCVACHSRLPDDELHPLGRQLLATQELAALPPAERAQFEMATRQFDAAAASYEAAFADPTVSPEDFGLTGHLDGYLELCLQVQHDPERATRTLRKLAERDDLPAQQRANVNAWIESLAALPVDVPVEEATPRALALIAQAEDRERFPDERQALVTYIAASGLLQRYIAAQAEVDARVGRAYYLLGVIEAAIGRSLWASQTEQFLETAIRIGPGEPYAPEALALLQEFVAAGYSGSGGTHVPQEVRDHLEELRRLIESAGAS